MKKIPYYLAILFFTTYFSLSLEANEIYRYIDKEGNIHFTDRPITGMRSLTVKTKIKTHHVKKAVKIYKFIDEEGIVHLTDEPKNSRYKLIYVGNAMLKPLSGGKYSAIAVLSKRYKKYDRMVQDVATLTNVEPSLIHAVIQVESAYNPNAISPKGAVGLMQLIPATAKRYGVVNSKDALSNMYGGAKYLRDLLDMFDGNIKLALAGYNAGENAVKRYGNKIPPYKETRNYVKKVMALYETHSTN